MGIKSALTDGLFTFQWYVPAYADVHNHENTTFTTEAGEGPKWGLSWRGIVDQVRLFFM